MKTARYIMMIVMLALILTACAGGQTTTTQNGAGNASATAEAVPPDAVIVEGHIVPARDTTLFFQGRGTVVKVAVQVGDKVRAGDVLARLGDASDATYAAAQLELVSAQKALDDLVNSRDAEFAQAAIDLKDAREEYEKADDYLTYLQNEKKVPQTQTKVILIQNWKGYEYRYKTHNFKGPAPQDWIIEAENDLALKKAAFDEAQRAYDRVKGGPDAEQLPLIEGRLNAAKAGVAAFEITAPFDGEIMDVNVSMGDHVGPETWAVKLADTSAWYVETSDLTELEIVKVSVGQPATILADALPDVPMRGAVDSASETFTSSGGDILYEVKVKIDSKDPLAKWGMTVEVTFEPLG